ncbi:MAG: aminoacyl--tRNA ligase-related protein [Patescibacteria group bacterium]
MRISTAFIKTLKNVPSDEVATNAQLLIKAGFIHKEMAGVYSYLTLGIRVLEKIKKIVREEMNALGGNEIIMTSLQRKELWEKTDRWDDQKVDVWFKSELKNGTPVGFGWSHEEPITDMMRHYVNSYRDLPIYVYQFQTKLRNELRAKSGIMRGREFVMKDMYSYTTIEKLHQKFYDQTIDAYHKVFQRVGIGEQTYLTFASGGAFTQFSHEFQTICEAGEDTVFIHKKKKLAINQEVLTDEVMKQLGVSRDELQEAKTAEVGNIFSFGETKAKQLGLQYIDEQGNHQPVILGSYGIGITRLMGVIAEMYHDDKGLIWPDAVAPAKVYLVSLGSDKPVLDEANKLYEELNNLGIEVIYDDRDGRPGEKFADCDLMGIPYRLVVSTKTLKDTKYEIKRRNELDSMLVNKDELIKVLDTTK